jgi:hypothetical protein
VTQEMPVMSDVNIEKLRRAFSDSWSKETSYPPTQDQWSPENPAFGQCAVTSLVINDLYGGQIVYNKDYHHYWNILDDGTVIDLTKIQFGPRATINHWTSSTREYILDSSAARKAQTPQRYQLLKNKVEQLLLVESVK